MLIFFILLIVLLSIFVILSLFFPERFPWSRPHLILQKSELQIINEPHQVHKPIIVEGLAESEDDHNDLEDRVDRLESILLEKNKTIDKLQKELTAEKDHRTQFEKVKSILDEEIKSLRVQNRELKNKKTGESNA